VYKTLKVERNWSLPQPHFKNQMKVVWLGPQGRSFDTVFQVPGTDYYVFHHRHTGELECWDISIGKSVTETLRVGGRLLDISPGQDLPGQFNMAILSSFSSVHPAAYCPFSFLFSLANLHHKVGSHLAIQPPDYLSEVLCGRSKPRTNVGHTT